MCFFLFYQKYFSLQDVNFDTCQIGGRKPESDQVKTTFLSYFISKCFLALSRFFFWRYSEVKKKRRESILKVQDIENFIRLIGDVSDP